MARPRPPLLRLHPWLLLLPAALAIAVAGCGDAGADPTPTSTPSPIATGTPAGSLREVDFEDPAVAAELIDRAGGGEVHQERVTFGDLIAGGAEEAVVVVESGGTMGDIGAGVYRLTAQGPELVFFVQTAGRIEVRRDLLVTVEGVYEAGDAQCCPSRLRETAYQWDGRGFAVASEQVIPNPQR